VPILLGFLDGGPCGAAVGSREFGPRCDLAAVDGLDATAMVAGQWDFLVPSPAELASDREAAEMIAPYGGQFPGLAPRPVSGADRG
jgi:hypothetical protein